ncbi:class I SAM-dependent methyltransferase [Pseudomonas sp. LRF_L74]|uniref:class I SAM-dependent methyltransferase n=1 Tax=Pseudomonas sp. LRF_L74 TaxID=3369422 RepID=UPI003F63FB96
MHDQQQRDLWNGPSGLAWVEQQELLDAMFEPFESVLAEVAGRHPRQHVLDVGCGTGSTTLAIARRLGPPARCSGIDLSAPMIARARQRAGRASRISFIRADAQRHAFPVADIDLFVSRFGVMFFDDPRQAFANLRDAASDSAGLCFIVWRSAAHNPFMTVAEQAVAALLPTRPARAADAPGQFALAEAGRVERLLLDSGWTDIAIRPLDIGCRFPVAQLPAYIGNLGPVGLALRSLDEESRKPIIETARRAFEPFIQIDDVRFNAACWLIEAHAASQ